MKNIFMSFALISLCFACATNSSYIQPVSQTNKYNANTTTLTDKVIGSQNNLEYYLNTTAGVELHGSGGSAYVGCPGAEPIFVVNGKEVGKSFAIAADYVRNMKIKSVRIMRHLEAESAFGLRSNDGVIVIRAEEL